MQSVLDIVNLEHLKSVQVNHPRALILVYVYKNGIAQGTLDLYRSIASSPHAASMCSRPIIFTRNSIEPDASIQHVGNVLNVPSLLFFVEGQLVRKLEDLSEHMVMKYIERHTIQEAPH